MVWVEGSPIGWMLTNVGSLAAVYNASVEYHVGDRRVCEVLRTPRKIQPDKDTGVCCAIRSTGALWWCTEVMSEGWLKKTGFDFVADRESPCLADASIQRGHITHKGKVF